jgi:hypothetical protein
MDLVALLKIPLVIGAVIVLVSVSRYSPVELSRRLTGWGCLLFGIGLILNCLFYPTQETGPWHELELIVRGIGMIIGLVFLVFGLRRLRDEPRASSEPLLSRRWWGWAFTGVGIAAGLTVLLNPAARDASFDTSPENLKWTILLGVMTMGVVIGRVLLTWGRKQGH